MTGNVADRVKRACAELAGSFRDHIRHGEDLIAVLVEKKMVIAEMVSAHVPMKILGLQIEGEDIGQQMPQFARNFHDSFASEATGNIPPGFVLCNQLACSISYHCTLLSQLQVRRCQAI